MIVEPFTIIIRNGTMHYRMQVSLLESDKSFEKFQISAGGKSVIIKGNRPMLHAKKLKHKPISWQLIEGSYTNQHLFQATIEAIEQHLNNCG